MVISLLALSNDRSLARLGGRLWKRLQRSNYFLARLVVAYGVIYQLIESRQRSVIGYRPFSDGLPTRSTAATGITASQIAGLTNWPRSSASTAIGCSMRLGTLPITSAPPRISPTEFCPI